MMMAKFGAGFQRLGAGGGGGGGRGGDDAEPPSSSAGPGPAAVAAAAAYYDGNNKKQQYRSNHHDHQYHNDHHHYKNKNNSSQQRQSTLASSSSAATSSRSSSSGGAPCSGTATTTSTPTGPPLNLTMDDVDVGEVIGKGTFCAVHSIKRFRRERMMMLMEGGGRGGSGSGLVSAEENNNNNNNSIPTDDESSMIRFRKMMKEPHKYVMKKPRSASTNDPKNYRKAVKDIQREAAMLSELDFKFIVKLHGVDVQNGMFLILTKCQTTLDVRIDEWTAKRHTYNHEEVQQRIAQLQQKRQQQRKQLQQQQQQFRCRFFGAGGGGGGNANATPCIPIPKKRIVAQIAPAMSTPEEEEEEGTLSSTGSNHQAASLSSSPITAPIMEEQMFACAELCYAIDYLHRRNIMHRDIKPENIGFNQYYQLQLLDFGLATKLRQYNKSKYDRGCYKQSTLAGSYPYVAPEIALGEKYGLSCDTFSLSLVIWEIITLSTPYGNTITPDTYIERVVQQQQRPYISNWWNPKLQSLLKECWQDNPFDRPPIYRVCDKMRDIVFALEHR